MARDEAWLTAQLAVALGWDEALAEGVVDAIARAGSDAEVKSLVRDFMQDNAAATKFVTEFRAARTPPQRAASAASHPPPTAAATTTSSGPAWQRNGSGANGSGSTGNRGGGGGRASGYSASLTGVAKAPPAQRAAAERQDREKWLHLGEGQQQQALSGAGIDGDDAALSSTALNASAAAAAALEAAEATLSMFKRGGRLGGKGGGKTAGGADGDSSTGKAARADGGAAGSITDCVERKVANCLSCGKIFDCRVITNDVIRFIQGGCHCTYCGAAVAVTQAARVAQARAQGDADTQGGTGAVGAGSDAVAAAEAFKDRLVDFDRNAQQRTTVIDDQSDFFEIDTNLWLSEEERAELKRREQEAAAAEAARRSRVTVTLDLLGRRVLLADQQAADGVTGISNHSATPGFSMGSTTDALQQGQQGVTTGATTTTTTAASSSSSRGGYGAEQQQQALQQMNEALQAMKELRITTSACGATPPPFFVPPVQQRQRLPAAQVASGAAGMQQQQAQQQQQQQPRPSVAAGGTKASKASASQQHGSGNGARSSSNSSNRARSGSGRSAAISRMTAAVSGTRVQDDNVFDDFGAEMLVEAVLAHAQQPEQSV